MNGTVPFPSAPLDDDRLRHFWSAAPRHFCSASSTTRSCACYCPRSGYAFDWLANAVQQQATTASRLENKVDRLAVLLETALTGGGLPAESTSDGHYMTPNDASEAGETAASSDPSSFPEPQSTAASDVDKSTVQPGSSQETVAFAAAGGGADSLPHRLSKFLRLATSSSAANGLVGAHDPSGTSPPSPSEDYDRLSTTSHDDHDSSTCESDDDDGFGDESERDEDQSNGSASFEAKTAAAVWPDRAGRRVGSWLESVE
ncbi:hypothetical protein JCM8115_006466 [Rhodotorula mucilaginosa]